MTDARADFEALTAENRAEVERLAENLRGLGRTTGIIAALGTVVEWGDEARLGRDAGDAPGGHGDAETLMPRAKSEPPKFTVTEKRRLFLPPDPPKKGPRCKFDSVLGRCRMVQGHDGWHFSVMDENAKLVTIKSDNGTL